MIELYAYEKLEEQLLTKLEERLKKAGVAFVPMSPQEMWAEISGTQNQKAGSGGGIVWNSYYPDKK